MDIHSHTLRTPVLCALILCFFCAESCGIARYTYGRACGEAIGIDRLKTETITEIFVPQTGRLFDVDLALNILHPSICDLQIYLISPSGTIACLNSYDIYEFVAFEANYDWTVFDDDTASSITRANAPFRGVFKPKITPLSVFDEEDPYGIWMVKIIDSVYGDTGTLAGARLDLFINPEPATIFLLVSGAGFIITKRRCWW
ncbi:MAG: proprotein convertase P-domain-containing protein [Anaerohalosphaeraceae bacterium]|nr:proprotein convertase P-domain-containing protein [Anaerohalosphaeraceae bacterium]